MLSTSKCEVVSIGDIQNHPAADNLEIVHVFGGYPCCVVKGSFKDGDLACYIPPDSVVDVSRPEFAFLAKGTKARHRVKCVKLRGFQSYGLLLGVPAGSRVGDDLADYFGVQHYEPEMKGPCTGGEAEPAPDRLSHLAKYDIDSVRRYRDVFEPGEVVFVTEKIHGTNARYSFMDGRMWCGSRSEWKRKEDGNLWWKALEATPSIEKFCREFPGWVLYGEVYGRVQDLKYGTKPGEVRFAAFDILWRSGEFAPAQYTRECLDAHGVPQVPLIGVVPFDFDTICAMAEGPSLIPGANHCREGCVARPIKERYHQAVGRVILKCVGSEYLTRS